MFWIDRFEADYFSEDETSSSRYLPKNIADYEPGHSSISLRERNKVRGFIFLSIIDKLHAIDLFITEQERKHSIDVEFKFISNTFIIAFCMHLRLYLQLFFIHSNG